MIPGLALGAAASLGYGQLRQSRAVQLIKCHWAKNGTSIYNTNGGGVGIGTDTPQVSLHNDGDFITKGPWADVRAFGAAGGAVGDPAQDVDDTAAIQAAFDSGAETVFFPGDAYSTDAINVPPTTRRIFGGGTLYQRTVGQNTLNVTGSQGLTIEGLRLQGIPGTNLESNNNGILVISSNKLTVRNNEVTGYRENAVWVRDTDDVQIVNNLIHGVAGGMTLTGVERGHVVGNTVRDRNLPDTVFSVAIGLDSTDGHSFGICRNIVIANNIIRTYVNSQAILMHAGERISVTGNVLEDVLIGVSANPFNSTDMLRHVTIQGNVYWGTSTPGAPPGQGNVGIVVGGGDGSPGQPPPVTEVAIVGNVISNANAVLRSFGDGGIGIQFADNVVVTDNVIQGCYAVGIAQSNTSRRVLFKDNLIADVLVALDGSTRAGIYTRGSCDGRIEDNNIIKVNWGMRFDQPSPCLFIGPNHFDYDVSKYVNIGNVTIKTTFDGDVDVAGTLTKGAGSFVIDHPLDPKNRFLAHSFVESPDMMNLYSGEVTLDEQGRARVELPEWFEALNRDFRYQLTCIGGFAPLYIAEEIAVGHFEIAGGTEGMRVSWQVTGTRKDAYAESHRIQVDQPKPARERGTYLHPGSVESREAGAGK